jgi:hypothetical protein
LQQLESIMKGFEPAQGRSRQSACLKNISWEAGGGDPDVEDLGRGREDNEDEEEEMNSKKRASPKLKWHK